MTEKTKPAVKSLAINANLAGLISVIALIREIIVANPQLIEDTHALFIALGALISQLIAVYGRWRAVSKVAGVFK